LLKVKIYSIPKWTWIKKLIASFKTKTIAYKTLKEITNMADRDGKGPRKRSPRRSVRKGGLKRGNC